MSFYFFDWKGGAATDNMLFNTRCVSLSGVLCGQDVTGEAGVLGIFQFYPVLLLLC
jgi:hypothetical protein